MSIIVVVKKNGKAVIAADTLYGFEGGANVKSSYLHNQSKIHKFGNSYIAVVGATAHENVLEHLFAKYKSKISFDSKKEIFETYLQIHPILRDEYFLNTTENDDDEYQSSQIDGLIANPNGIFGIYTWREVYEFEKFWAIGSGRDYALGVLFANYDTYEEPEKLAEVAINAACEFDDGCGLPTTIHSIKLVEKS
jgi:ATP-dependent HslUV protease, peptidase subunit HslV